MSRSEFEQQLLQDVSCAYVAQVDEDAGWPDPHLLPDSSRRSPADDEYSRLRDPAKYRVLQARARAWSDVLVQRGWADAAGNGRAETPLWVPEPRLPLVHEWCLVPVAAGAISMYLAYTAGGAEGEVPGLVIGALGKEAATGAPAVVPIQDLPVCGCDACDNGSDYLLGEIDETVLGVLDGSLEATVAKGRIAVRSSFGGHSSSAQHSQATHVQVLGKPWNSAWDA